MKKTRKAFTFVELLMVVIILWILATLSFLILWDSLKEARDATRIDNLKELENKIDYYKNKTGYYPNPDGPITIEIKDWKEWNIWVIWSWVIKELWDTTIIPLDPKTNSNYIYMLTKTWQLYKLKAHLEVTEEDHILPN